MVFLFLCHTDAIDNGQNKKAIQIADKIIKKQVDLHCAKVWCEGRGGEEGQVGRLMNGQTDGGMDRRREGGRGRGTERQMEGWRDGGMGGEREEESKERRKRRLEGPGKMA